MHSIEQHSCSRAKRAAHSQQLCWCANQRCAGSFPEQKASKNFRTGLHVVEYDERRSSCGDTLVSSPARRARPIRLRRLRSSQGHPGAPPTRYYACSNSYLSTHYRNNPTQIPDSHETDVDASSCERSASLNVHPRHKITMEYQNRPAPAGPCYPYPAPGRRRHRRGRVWG